MKRRVSKVIAALASAALVFDCSLLASAQASRATAPAAPPVSTAVEHAALTKADVDAWLDGYMPYALNAGDVAGAVVVVVKDGQVLTERGFGYADVAAKKPVDAKTTLFRPGSTSKLFTWT